MKKTAIFKKTAVAAVLAGAILTCGVITAQAAAGQWKQNDTGWWWERTGGWYPTNTWLWIDGNNDGKAECYYFDNSGYMLANTVTPDGYTVNTDGTWTENGVVQTQLTNSNLHEVGAVNGTNATATNGAIMDGKSWPQMAFDETLWRAATEWPNGFELLQGDKTVIGQHALGLTYAMQYNGQTISINNSTASNTVAGYYGPVSAFFSNFPEQGMELNAFYDNTGYESFAWGRKPHGTTGNSDQIFGLPQGSYRMGAGSVGQKPTWRNFSILLTAGTNGNYYIFPDSPMYVN